MKRRTKAVPRPDRLTSALVISSLFTLGGLFFTAGWIVAAAGAIPPRRSRAAVAAAPPALPRPRLVVRYASLVPAQQVSALDEWIALQPVPLPDWHAISLAANAPVPGPDSLRPMIRDAALRQSLSPELVEAIARVESDFNPYEVSEKGALGLLQVMPETGKRFGVARERLFDPEANLAAGTKYLAWLLERYRGDLDLALAAYNAGEGAVDEHGGIPPYRETQQYVRRVRAALRAISNRAS